MLSFNGIAKARISGEAQAVEAVRNAAGWPATNRDPSRLTVLTLTGVTALTRATGETSLKGYDLIDLTATVSRWGRTSFDVTMRGEVAGRGADRLGPYDPGHLDPVRPRVRPRCLARGGDAGGSLRSPLGRGGRGRPVRAQAKPRARPPW